MNKEKTILLFLLYISNAGCNFETKSRFENEANLKGHEVCVKSLLNPKSLLIHDSLIFIKERAISLKSLKIMHLDDFDLLSNAVILGKGPGELTNPASMVIDKNKNILWYSDWGKYKCFQFPIDSLLINPDYKPTESFMINRGFMPMMNMFYYPPRYFGFSNFITKDLVNFIDINGQIIDSLKIANKVFPNLWEDFGFSDNPLIVHYNFEKNKIVVANNNKNQLAVIDPDGYPAFRIEKKVIKSKPKKNNTTRGRYYSYFMIDSDDDYIYCLYVGGMDQIYNKETNSISLNYPTRLLVYNWEGIGVYDIHLDHPLKYFAIDKERKRLIGITKDFKNGLVLYDLIDKIKY